MLVDVGSVALAGALYAGLKEAGILVRYWASRPDLNSKLRITVGAKESNEKFIALTRKLLAELKKVKPASAKGVYVKKVTLSTTMGPGLAIDQASLEA